MRLKQKYIFRKLLPFIIKGERLSRFRSIPDNIMVCNLKNGIPFEDNTVKAVYHSHFLEHIDRPYVHSFLCEVNRVLVPGGIQRIVVPDFELLCRKYLQNIDLVKNDHTELSCHDFMISAVIEQCVRKESYGSSQQTWLFKKIENIFLGDARKRGETHQWMYDQYNLTDLLTKSGFGSVEICKYNTSSINLWNEYGLDLDQDGSEYKTDSLYIEAVKI